MSETSTPLWLHVYSGKENGLMIVGTSSSLKVLGQQLLAAAESESKPSYPSWPTEIARPEILGPYKDVPDYKLSFHLQGSSPLESVVPIGRRNMPTFVFIAIGACALVGVFTIIQWIV